MSQYSFKNSNNFFELSRTAVEAKPSPFKIDHQSSIMFIGSCFSENISSELIKLKFDVTVNAQGILFNPISTTNCIDNIVKRRTFTKHDIFSDQIEPTIWHSWDHHSKYSSSNPDNMIERINTDINLAHQQLLKAKVLFITLGTSHVHILKSSNQIVSNCHKQPSNLFYSHWLTVDEILKPFIDTVSLCQEFNPQLQIVLTVSPVRHTREGLEENMMSKSTLIYASHQLKNFYQHITYFPSYEYMMDELRDYRWYGDDLIHPSKPAIDYIFSKFLEKYCDQSTIDICEKIIKINNNINHIPRFTDSPSYEKHLNNTISKIKDLKNYMNNVDELFMNELNSIHHILSFMKK
eukprot:gene13044-17481_t